MVKKDLPPRSKNAQTHKIPVGGGVSNREDTEQANKNIIEEVDPDRIHIEELLQTNNLNASYKSLLQRRIGSASRGAPIFKTQEQHEREGEEVSFMIQSS